MSRQTKRILGAAAIVLVTGVVGLLIYPRSPGSGTGGAGPGRAPGGFVSLPPEPAPPNSPPAEQQVATMMEAWRGAIVGRDADTVLTCDRTFLADPRTFTPALVRSAQSDPETRVRAFSTRVLGKFSDEALIEVFRGLLADTNPFVRQNAAWSLGELGERARGLGAELERLQRRDRDEQVRRAAGEALNRVRGSVAPRGAG